MAYLQPIDAHLNSPLRLAVTQSGKPPCEVFSLANFDQAPTV